MKEKIIIKDNFFSKDILDLIQKDLLRLKFKNRYTDLRNVVYQKIYFHVPLNIKHFAIKEMIKNVKEYDLQIKNLDASYYFLSTKHKEATPHSDNGFINCLIYLKGTHSVNNGTGFYDLIDNKFQLNTHVGFKENRAIIFDGDIDHTSLQFNENCGPRYVMANFFKKID
jgi:hypothetical protein|tara:strand:+ start:1031 stop:1537 length:507 start_codon:yes stop_codon:yes gene_type:complete